MSPQKAYGHQTIGKNDDCILRNFRPSTRNCLIITGDILHILMATKFTVDDRTGVRKQLPPSSMATFRRNNDDEHVFFHHQIQHIWCSLFSICYSPSNLSGRTW